MTVAGQLEGLLDDDSLYRKNAETAALQTANARGLLNSSIAASAGTKAAIDSALPIASQDASTYYNQNIFNLSAKNQFALANTGYENQFKLAEYQGQIQTYTQQVGIQAQMATLSQQQSFALQSQWLSELMAINTNSQITAAQRNGAIADANARYGSLGVYTSGVNYL